MQTLKLELGERSYSIHIAPGLLQQPQLILPQLRGKQVLIVTNTTVAPLYLQTLTSSLQQARPDLDIRHCILPDGEAYKDITHLQLIWDALLEAGFNRHATLVALGGGVIGDMTGFAAACYQRGIAFIQVPTTLLSQVDSSVGGKTGVNHPLGKNMIGAFWQPRAVIIDTNTLKTLPQREVAAGMAEVIKYGLLADANFLDWLEQHMAALMAGDPVLLAEAIARSCQCKADIVAEDERESGKRALLNLGHTFGHAIETEMGYGVWLHGEAVGCGMWLAADLSRRLGWLTGKELQRIEQLLLAASLPVRPPAKMSVDAFLRHMAVDKKNLDGQLRLILLQKPGEAVLMDFKETSLLRQCLSDAL
ncbi:3-dehydroquinate synthase [Marinospirillum alkaliphilum]|uniref:3-dehydroquinate synthase n=1 Tax=Marinospirillum alkaliphilum DSM 21637 TaxID=1122209 RepID=A0A1K1W4R1_9GAMM|nr:3-dehydroquinate synthase [Marinospirillum alkaliphilum]SFX32362.1 3-dehydroquinate synthase [Marinospirillum alkaliphilum DSM 21637]